jgi:hypothetical protein
MVRFLRIALLVLGFTLFVPLILPADLWAFTIIETHNFKEGPYIFKIEVQVSGRGSIKRPPTRITSLKVKIKNEKGNPEILKIKTIRVYTDEKVYSDIESRGYSVAPAQWVTKYYRLRKEKQPALSDKGFIEIHFENFTVLFSPRERKFLGPFR